MSKLKSLIIILNSSMCLTRLAIFKEAIFSPFVFKGEFSEENYHSESVHSLIFTLLQSHSYVLYFILKENWFSQQQRSKALVGHQTFISPVVFVGLKASTIEAAIWPMIQGGS